MPVRMGLAKAVTPVVVSRVVNQADTISLVAAMDIEYQAAVENNDDETMARILADDFVLVTGKGRVFTRRDLLDEARSGHVVYEYQYADERTVRVWGDTAVVTALLHAKGRESGEPFCYELWYSDTYVDLDGVWEYVLGQASTRLPEKSEG